MSDHQYGKQYNTETLDLVDIIEIWPVDGETLEEFLVNLDKLREETGFKLEPSKLKWNFHYDEQYFSCEIDKKDK